MSYFNTTSLSGAALLAAQFIAMQQDVAVMDIMADGYARTPSAVWEIGKARGKNWLLTSVRRSISNLEREQELVKMDVLRPGPYGKPEHVWVKP